MYACMLNLNQHRCSGESRNKISGVVEMGLSGTVLSWGVWGGGGGDSKVHRPWLGHSSGRKSPTPS